MELSVLCEVRSKAITETEIFEFVRSQQHGGMNFFFGSVRDFNAGKKVVSVAYDTFEPLAVRSLQEIAGEAREKWGQSIRICVIHRVGKLGCGEISVGIGVSSKHRDESYQASRYIIEQLKHRTPIWKKEFYENGETEWLKGHALCQAAGCHG